MNVLAVLENETMMQPMAELFGRTAPDVELMCFGSTPPALAAARSTPIDVAVIDAVLPELSGLDFGEYLKELYPEVNLIYLTKDRVVGFDALRQHASGILLKPVIESQLKQELNDLRYGNVRKREKRLFAQTFGNFELFADGRPVVFKYSKTKEMVALLVNNRGAQTTNGEIIATLWEDDGDPDIATDRIECDLYDWLEKRQNSRYHYLGDYMNQYSWPEVMHAELDEISWSLPET